MRNDDIFEQFDAAKDRLANILAQAQANTVRASELAEQARTLQITMRSDGGEVTVTAGVGGVITAVEFGATAFDVSTTELSRLALHTIAAAQNAAANQFAERAAMGLPPDSALGSAWRDDANRAFPAPKNDSPYA